MYSETHIENYPEYLYPDTLADKLCKFASYGMLVGMGVHYFCKFMEWL
jgi:hypothetical protein